MIDKTAIISFNGVEIWSRTDQQLNGSPINILIQKEIDRTRLSDSVKDYVANDYRMHYLVNCKLEMIFVTVSKKQFQFIGTESFLRKLVNLFLDVHEGQDASLPYPITNKSAFDKKFDDLLESFLKLQSRSYINSHPQTYVPVEETGENHREKIIMEKTDVHLEKLKIVENEPLRILKATVGPGGRRTKIAGKGPKADVKPSQPPKKKDKKNRQWNDEAPDPNPSSPIEEELLTTTDLIRHDSSGEIAPVSLSNWDDVNPPKLPSTKTAESTGSALFRKLKNRFGSRELSEEDMEEVLPALREKLLIKNVAVPVVDKIIESVTFSLKGKSLSSFQNLNTFIEESMKATLVDILSPKTEIDLIKDVSYFRQETRKPYTICFCGVNGVGKSTSLSKIAFFLKHSGFSLLVAACDTFRGGAVEQLEVHCRTIDIALHKQGYGLDAAKVAANAISRAKKENIDVVLIDTAGRMQGHDARMTALSKLIYEIKPNLTLFVGEALVGNDGSDQLNKFNDHFMKSVPVGETPRGVDAIFLTKFDTIDDKVGAAISMSYGSRQPIAFVGVGQTYQDIKKLDIDLVARTLMA